MGKSKPPKPPGQFKVGYGRPPEEDQFGPGKSGNPVAVEKASRPPTKRS
jgi:hypothetical protein